MEHEFGITLLGEGKDALVLRMCGVCGLTHVLNREFAFWKEITEPLQSTPCLHDDLDVRGEHIGFTNKRGSVQHGKS